MRSLDFRRWEGNQKMNSLNAFIVLAIAMCHAHPGPIRRGHREYEYPYQDIYSNHEGFYGNTQHYGYSEIGENLNSKAHAVRNVQAELSENIGNKAQTIQSGLNEHLSNKAQAIQSAQSALSERIGQKAEAIKAGISAHLRNKARVIQSAQSALSEHISQKAEAIKTGISKHLSKKSHAIQSAQSAVSELISQQAEIVKAGISDYFLNKAHAIQAAHAAFSVHLSNRAHTAEVEISEHNNPPAIQSAHTGSEEQMDDEIHAVDDGFSDQSDDKDLSFEGHDESGFGAEFSTIGLGHEAFAPSFEGEFGLRAFEDPTRYQFTHYLHASPSIPIEHFGN